MAQKTNHIKPSVAFSTLAPAVLVLQAKSVHDNMTNNPLYVGAPVTPEVLQAAIDAYIAAAAEAMDSKRAIAEREKQHLALIRLLRQLAHFVEVAAKDDMATFMTSGFQPAIYAHSTPQALPPAGIVKIDQGTTGQFLVTLKSLSRARLYELRYGAAGAGGATPATWTSQTIPNAKRAVVIDNLTPGTTYVFQVRAYGLLGYTDWSDSISRMAI
jgi:hypothetical protein